MSVTVAPTTSPRSTAVHRQSVSGWAGKENSKKGSHIWLATKCSSLDIPLPRESREGCTVHGTVHGGGLGVTQKRDYSLPPLVLPFFLSLDMPKPSPALPMPRRQEYCRVVTAGGRMALSLDRAVELYESRRYASMACGRCPWPTKTHEYAPCTQVEPLVGHTTHNAQADEGRVEPDEGQRGDLRLVKQLWERCTLIMNPRGLYDRITSVARAFTRMGESNGGGPWWGNPPGAPRS